MCFMPKVSVPKPPPVPQPEDAEKARQREYLRRANAHGFAWSVYAPAGDISQAPVQRPTILGS
ncbi:MAG: hypothetical protein GC190_21135 [Alphaproteobacteria bacterium]|nr:hypothetical protein [Alphaproteobacteria bacterium]